MRVLVTSGLIAFALTQSGQDVSISFPPWVSGGTCVSGSSGARIDVRASKVVIDCRKVGRILCDLDLAEPTDLDIKTTCAVGRVPVLQGHRRIVEAETGEKITVEWIDWPVEQAPVVLAARPLGADGSVALARSANRFVRFSRPNRSPLTVPEGDLPTTGPWHLPDIGAGGEVVVAVALAPVRPTAIRLETGAAAPLGQFGVDQHGRVRVPALPVGKLTWRPSYEGNVIGPPGTVEIVSGRSLPIVILRQDVGQIRATLDADLCADAGQIKVSALRVTSGGARIENERARANVEGKCSYVFGGLPPGTYEVRADSGASGPVGAAVVRTVLVASQQEAVVDLAAPGVSMSGTVLLNGRPYPRPDLTILLRRQGDNADARISGNVLAGGGYSVRLPAPGRYSVSLAVRELPLVGTKRDVIVNVGENLNDWSIEGGTVKVRIEQWDHSTPVQLTFEARDSVKTGIAYASLVLQASDDETFELPGIAFGSYSLQARQVLRDKSVRVSTTVRTEVRETGSAPEVTLRLADYGSEISLVDNAAQPVVTPATLRSPREGPLPQVAPGLFRATSKQVSVGDPISVLAVGYLATCILAPPNGGSTTVTLQPGIRTLVEIRASVRWGSLPGWVTLPGAACPIAFGLFARERLDPESAPGGEVISRFVLTQLPAQGVLFQADLAEPPAPLIRNADGVLVIRR